MDTEIKPQPERRKEDGAFSHIAAVFIGRQSRKVAFGVWGFLADNTFLATGKITEKTWWFVFLTCALLIGFGTIVDSILLKVGDQLAAKAADKLKGSSDALAPAA